MGGEQLSGEVLSWLKTLPLAPEYHPTIQEFQDPISYIFKIEKEASKYGICKIVPPVPHQSKKSVISNFNRSLAERSSSPQPENPKSQPTFTTRQQQIGFCPRKQRPVQKSVWQSGEHYTLQQFEAKAKSFERNYLKNKAKKAVSVSALEVETLFWKANGDRPFSVEYANDMPGSAFGPVKERRWRDSGETGVGAGNVSDTAWNMRGIARSNGSLLRFMKEDIPGVTSPMVYVAMMFSWFAWHVEDHDLHSLNYMHLGAGKTWYGVPRDAATAFEEVIRVHGFGEEINPLVTFAMLGEKTSVMSPEVLIRAGVPCCRLVQNAGEFVVTFPRAYHSGFSHGFNCGEASNIATPEWLRFAKDAAIRRASVNYPPMVSHFQLLYDLAVALSSSNPSDASNAPRSSRLKDKKRGEGDNLVKQLFVEDLMQNNNLLHTLGKGSAVVLLPQNPSERFICSNLHVGSRYKVKSSLPLQFCSLKEAVKSSKGLDSDEIQKKGQVDKRFKTYYSRKAKFSSMGQGVEAPTCNGSNVEAQRGESTIIDGLSDRGLFSCVKCGIWPFACVAIVQPTESTSRYLMSPDFNLDDLLVIGELNDGSIAANAYTSEPNCGSGWTRKNAPPDGQYDVAVQSTEQMETVDHCTNSIQSSDYECEKVDETFKMDTDTEMRRSSALGLLALTYGNASDSDEDDIPHNGELHCNGSSPRDGSWESISRRHDSASPFSHQQHTSGPTGNTLKFEDESIVSHSITHSYKDREFSRVDSDDSDFGISELAEGFLNNGIINKHYIPTVNTTDFAENSTLRLLLSQRLDEDSSRMHVFCLEHAVELERLLRPVGGIHIMLLCHSDYPKVEDAAKLVAQELHMDNCWNNTAFRATTKEDEERIQLALQSEEETPKSGDWAVKLGINLYYSSVLCRSPLYSKQMPFNSVIYSAFGCTTPTSPKELQIRGKWSSRQKKVVMAGKWCGKVWMSNQVHPSLVKHDEEEEETFADRLKTEAIIFEKRETVQKSGTSSRPRTAVKRKMKIEDRSIKKMKSQETKVVVSASSDDSVDVKSHQEHKRNVRKSVVGRRTIKKGTFSGSEFADSGSEDSADVGIVQEQKKNTAKNRMSSSRSIKKAKPPEIETEDSNHEHPVEDVEHHPKQRRSIRSQRFKGQTNFRGGLRTRVADNRCNPDSEAELENTEPSSRLRKRAMKPQEDLETDAPAKKQSQKSKGKKTEVMGPKMRLPTVKSSTTAKGPKMRLPVKESTSRSSARKASSTKPKSKGKEEGEDYFCDIEGCTMSFKSEEDLSLHQRNICPVEDCYKKFFSHKYLVQHRRVHEDDRPLKCPWKGCKMTFKWAWARTEHIRVHTGARPYVCKEPGCGQTFRFVSDFSRHKRKTGHSVRKKT